MPLTWDEDRSMFTNGAAVPDAAVAVAAPTKAEFDALVAKFNLLLVAARDSGLISLD